MNATAGPSTRTDPVSSATPGPSTRTDPVSSGDPGPSTLTNSLSTAAPGESTLGYPVSTAAPEKMDAGECPSNPGENKSAQPDQGIPGTSTGVKIPSVFETIQRVHHAHFKWTIEHFSLYPDVQDEYCLSPAFGLHETWWSLALHPKARSHGVDKIALNIVRRRSGRGPTVVTVTYRLGLESHDNRVWFQQWVNVPFAKGDCSGFQTSLLGDLEDFVSLSDSISVLCELYLDYEKRASQRNKTRVDLELPSNLFSLLRSEVLSDTMVESSDSKRRAHKAILSARSTTMARLLEDGRSYLRLPCSPWSLSCALAYIYTGSFTHVARDCTFDIGTYELARKLSLVGLRDLLRPSDVAMTSRITEKRIVVKWTLLRFRLADILDDDIHGGYYMDSDAGIGVGLSLKRLKSDGDNVELFVSVHGLAEEALRRAFDVYLCDREATPFERVAADYRDARFERSELSLTALFSTLDVLRCCHFDGGRLSVYLRCERLSALHLPHLTRSRLQPPPPENLDALWLESLSVDLCRLWANGVLSDVSLLSSAYEFRAHRCLLAARSDHFVRLFGAGQHKQGVLAGDDIEPFILFLILMFAYAGRFASPVASQVAKMDVLRMYEYAEIFCMRSLKVFCERHLCANLDPEITTCVMSTAQRCRNEWLVRECLQYLRGLTEEDSITEDDSSDFSEEEYSEDGDEDANIGENEGENIGENEGANIGENEGANIGGNSKRGV